MPDPTLVPALHDLADQAHVTQALDLLRPDTSSWSSVDLVVAVVVVLAAAGAVRRGRGLLGALATVVTTGLVAWLVVGALATFATGPVASAARGSALLGVAPAPTRALLQADRLIHGAR